MFLREDELEELEDIYKRDGADLVILYGRRRLGKTTLALKLLERHGGAYIYTPRGDIRTVLKEYAEALRSQLGLRISGFESFRDFLEALYEASKEEKVLVVVDEFQRLQEADESSMSVLQDFWDRRLSRTRVKLFLVGSLIGVVERLAIRGDAPLFGRATAQLKVGPLPYFRARRFWRRLGPEERVVAYGIFGGTPAYMDSFDFGRDLWSNVESLVVRKSGRLNNEPENLLASELRSPAVYMSVLDRIAQGERGMPLGKIHVSGSNPIPYIRRLEKMDIIERLHPLGEQRRGAVYAFKDEFFRFWFRYIRRNYWLIEMGRYGAVMGRIRGDINSYLSFTYERVLRELLAMLSGREVKGVRIPEFQKFGPYWDSEVEVDALGVARDCVVVGEAKWWEGEVGIKEISRTVDKAERLAEKFGRREYVVVIASRKGFRREYDEEGIVLLSHEDVEKLFDELSG